MALQYGCGDIKQACDKNVVLMGYWPPTNNMLRQWSTHPEQNPGTWQGQNWRGLGYDVYAFFPEFPPDDDPTNDSIGSPGSVGSPDFDLQIDYQATSQDFWRIVDAYQPQILITNSRGGSIGWEIEAYEGRAEMAASPELDWRSDDHGDEHQPSQDTIDARSWQAISTYRGENLLASALPMDQIFDVVSGLNLTNVAIDEATSGSYLSGFLGLHGLYYHETHRHNLAAGHIHVGGHVSTEAATAMMEATLETVLKANPVATSNCP
ncbi:MAG: hypothetical protein NXH95_07925 [Pseudomonadaceae bacterium]|nr:hypothetical protein [Pseudomonadaceae bacterium]